MCVCLVVKSNRPSLDILTKCDNTNSDGMGIGYFKNKQVHYKKGFTSVQELFNFIQDIPLPFSVHFRLASCGGKNPLLIHPFEINRSSPLKMEGVCDKALFHNGHLSDHEKLLAAASIYPAKDEVMSDTRAIAMIMDNNLKFVEHLHGKYVIMDGATGLISITPFNDFTEIDGIYYSNTYWQHSGSHKNYYSGSYRYNIGGWDEDSEFQRENTTTISPTIVKSNAVVVWGGKSKKMRRKARAKMRSKIYMDTFNLTGSSILAQEAAASYKGDGTDIEDKIVPKDFDYNTLKVGQRILVTGGNFVNKFGKIEVVYNVCVSARMESGDLVILKHDTFCLTTEDDDVDRLNTEQPNYGEQSNSRIHEQPPLPPFHTDNNTRKILGFQDHKARGEKNAQNEENNTRPWEKRPTQEEIAESYLNDI